ncbi:hypothetical protein Pcinc_032029 [Petrolisthes cinctipes]|uniref:Uncharacterized protein n=1 Tax=Petrolisthes cinctipes TaxID=88211 RepID=A0AAE1K3Z9_PETCI|nr:hypothetical protein Pcinc_032029 [Petrolisthes cinctipes]
MVVARLVTGCDSNQASHYHWQWSAWPLVMTVVILSCDNSPTDSVVVVATLVSCGGSGHWSVVVMVGMLVCCHDSSHPGQLSRYWLHWAGWGGVGQGMCDPTALPHPVMTRSLL